MRHARILIGVFLLGGSVAVAQGALAQFKVTEAEARQTILDELRGGVGGHMNRTVVDMARKAYASIPASGRGAATTALYAWTKAHVNSPGFKSAYAAFRKENTPVENTHQGTVDEEVARIVNGEKAELEKTIEEMLAAGMKAQADAMRQQGKMFEDKFYQQAKRADVEEKRAYDKKDYETALANFNETLPADPLVSIAKHLRAFVDATPDVDFTAKQKVVQGEGGSGLVFVNEAYQNKPWQWRLAFEFGPEAISAARAAAQAWLQELGAK
jgi:hypothetical protein